MLEIVFNRNLANSLRLAQTPYEPALVGVGVDFDTELSEQAAQQQQEAEKVRRAWQKAVPLGSSAQDIFCFSLGLSMGTITRENFFDNRINSLSQLFSIFPEELPHLCKETQDAAVQLDTVCGRAQQSESIRIWYSDSPEEACGFFWFLTELQRRICTLPPISALKLPPILLEQDSACSCQSWGDLCPEKLHLFVSLAEPVSPALAASIKMQWSLLEEENAPLRAVVSGQLQSVPASFYDCFLEAELDQMEEEFSEAQLIGQFIGKHPLGVGDYWAALRIEQMIQAGRLLPCTYAKNGELPYRRMLKKLR